MIFVGDFPPTLLLIAYFKQLTDQIINETAEASGNMTANQLELVTILGEQMTMKDVAHALRMQPSNVTGLVDSCAEAGWVQRIQSKEDRRRKYLSLTEEGSNLRKLILNIMARRICETSGITDELASQILSKLQLLEAA